MPSSVMCVAPTGDDTNDGRTWDYPKATVLGAYDALPNEGGTIFFTSASPMGTKNVDGGTVGSSLGLWIVGPNDPGWNSGNMTAPLRAAGWRRQKILRLVGVGGGVGSASSFDALNAYFSQNGSQTDISKPALWITGTNVPLMFENISWQYPAVCFRAAIEAGNYLGDRSINTALVRFRNCTMSPNSVAGNGPTIDSGYSFWVDWEGCQFGVQNVSWVPTNISGLTATTFRVTTSVAHRLAVNDTVRFRAYAPTTWNGIWNVINVPTTTTFDIDVLAAPGAVVTPGNFQPYESDTRAAIVLKGTPPNAGLWWFKDCLFSYGGIRYHISGATGSGQVIMENVSFEGSFDEVPVAPIPAPIEVIGGTRDLNTVVLRNVQKSDASPDPRGISHDGNLILNKLAGDLIYPNTAVMEFAGKGRGEGIINLTDADPEQEQQGFSGEGIVGRWPGVNYAGAPTVVRYVNQLSHDPSTWGVVSGTTTKTTGIADPMGGTDAARFTSSITGVDGCRIANTLHTYSAGDRIVVGAWLRAASTQGFFGFYTAQGTMQVDAFGGPVRFYPSLEYWSKNTVPFDSDGSTQRWGWYVWHETVTVGGLPAGERTNFFANDTHPIEVFAPTQITVPAAVSEAEFQAIKRHFTAYPSTAPVGSLSVLRNHDVYIPLGSVGMSELAADPAAPATNGGLLYLKDNGSGKTQLCVRFATGAVQVVATQP